MLKQKDNRMSFLQPYVERRKIKDIFFTQINTLIDWHSLESLVNKHYQKGNSAVGRKAYPSLLLLKMCLLQTWYSLSDYEIEEAVNDRISFMKFCGLQFEDDVPDHSIISRFRSTLTEANAYDELLQAINKQLAAKNILIKEGVIIDASITPTPHRPKGKKVYEIQAEEKSEATSIAASSNKHFVTPPVLTRKTTGDQEGSWVKKNGKIYYGYKKHYLVDQTHGLVEYKRVRRVNMRALSSLLSWNNVILN
jgi:transposase, IS5 family